MLAGSALATNLCQSPLDTSDILHLVYGSAPWARTACVYGAPSPGWAQVSKLLVTAPHRYIIPAVFQIVRQKKMRRACMRMRWRVRVERSRVGVN